MCRESNHYFSVCLWGCFWKRLIFESVNWVRKIHTHPIRRGTSHFLGKKESTGKELFVFWSLEVNIFSYPGRSELQIPQPLDSRTCPNSTSCSQVIGLEPSFATSLADIPACRWLIVGLCGLCNYVSSFLFSFHLSLSCVSICFSGETWLIQSSVAPHSSCNAW